MRPKELIDKITLAEEQLEALRTEHDLPISVGLGEDVIYLGISNKKRSLQITFDVFGYMDFCKAVGGRPYHYNTYEKLVNGIKTDG